MNGQLGSRDNIYLSASETEGRKRVGRDHLYENNKYIYMFWSRSQYA